MDFNNLDELYLNLEKKKEFILGSLGEYAKGVLSETIEEEIYNGDFQPRYYQRRYKNGGFGDENNININKISSDVIEITNDTLANGDDYGERLDSIIEEGNYKWRRHPEARPVFEITNQKLNENRILEKIAKKEFESLGFKIE